MKSPRELSGRELADALCKNWSYREVGQTVLRIGTLNAILRLVATHKSVPRQQILDTIKQTDVRGFLFAWKSDTLLESWRRCLTWSR